MSSCENSVYSCTDDITKAPESRALHPERALAHGDGERCGSQQITVNHKLRGRRRLEHNAPRLFHRDNRVVHVLPARFDLPVELRRFWDRPERPVGIAEVKLPIIELRERREAVSDASVLVNEACEEEQVVQLRSLPVDCEHRR
eukprot:CAMPEP_0181183286 /NCGR_PEP_ID=MMETSP1096-20121128/8346_1 /TAXON_ID=156174 ORGANISM="Chrysochromulina ericina, Strain CCMP281" /NCGR_SAMPLE_ID=MMETSP1096 /ASSEMBLY_ACC=CAM_ASM_000453 /LENGTH=143 /DNA_ID=CAMNT_0023271959 /DNA_START=136 /DNA_END=568 /DNA_ORIENTATION=-